LFATVDKRLAGGGRVWLLARGPAAVVCLPVLRTETLEVMLEIRGNMGQYESEDRDFKE
jgi:hypothetical protein